MKNIDRSTALILFVVTLGFIVWPSGAGADPAPPPMGFASLDSSCESVKDAAIPLLGARSVTVLVDAAAQQTPDWQNNLNDNDKLASDFLFTLDGCEIGQLWYQTSILSPGGDPNGRAYSGFNAWLSELGFLGFSSPAPSGVISDYDRDLIQLLSTQIATLRGIIQGTDNWFAATQNVIWLRDELNGYLDSALQYSRYCRSQQALGQPDPNCVSTLQTSGANFTESFKAQRDAIAQRLYPLAAELNNYQSAETQQTQALGAMQQAYPQVIQAIAAMQARDTALWQAAGDSWNNGVWFYGLATYYWNMFQWESSRHHWHLAENYLDAFNQAHDQWVYWFAVANFYYQQEIPTQEAQIAQLQQQAAQMQAGLQSLPATIHNTQQVVDALSQGILGLAPQGNDLDQDAPADPSHLDAQVQCIHQTVSAINAGNQMVSCYSR